MKKIIVAVFTIHQLLTSAAFALNPPSQPKDCRDFGCPSGYTCAPFFAGRFTCFKDHPQVLSENFRQAIAPRVTVVGKDCKEPWSDAGIFENAEADSAAKAAALCSQQGYLRAVPETESQFTEYYVGIKHCAEASSDYLCSNDSLPYSK